VTLNLLPPKLLVAGPWVPRAGVRGEVDMGEIGGGFALAGVVVAGGTEEAGGYDLTPTVGGFPVVCGAPD